MKVLGCGWVGRDRRLRKRQPAGAANVPDHAGGAAIFLEAAPQRARHVHAHRAASSISSRAPKRSRSKCPIGSCAFRLRMSAGEHRHTVRVEGALAVSVECLGEPKPTGAYRVGSTALLPEPPVPLALPFSAVPEGATPLIRCGEAIRNSTPSGALAFTETATREANL